MSCIQFINPWRHIDAKQWTDKLTSPELAQNYKEDGNRHFQAKKYHLAIENYTAGIKENSPDSRMNAILHANRAAAHFRLQNFRLDQGLNFCQEQSIYWYIQQILIGFVHDKVIPERLHWGSQAGPKPLQGCT